jgi:Rps23 Pro-64 3,4-dihydroxylase Tpa1-like proline 4-hydroxylase
MEPTKLELNITESSTTAAPIILEQDLLVKPRRVRPRKLEDVENKYPYIKREEFAQVLPVAKQFKVSEMARSKGQFVDQFLAGDHTIQFWIRKRNNYLSRSIPTYEKYPTWRRYLSLVVWAFNPEKGLPIYLTQEEYEDAVFGKE